MSRRRTMNTERLNVKVSAQILGEIREQLMIHNGHGGALPWDVSEFLRRAVMQYLKELRRKRKATQTRLARQRAARQERGQVTPLEEHNNRMKEIAEGWEQRANNPYSALSAGGTENGSE